MTFKKDEKPSETPGAAPEATRTVHTAHCCWVHGCKYGDDTCAVVAGRAEQEQPCESCGDDGIASLDIIRGIKAGTVPTCPHCRHVLPVPANLTVGGAREWLLRWMKENPEHGFIHGADNKIVDATVKMLEAFELARIDVAGKLYGEWSEILTKAGVPENDSEGFPRSLGVRIQQLVKERAEGGRLRAWRDSLLGLLHRRACRNTAHPPQPGAKVEPTLPVFPTGQDFVSHEGKYIDPSRGIGGTVYDPAREEEDKARGQ